MTWEAAVTRYRNEPRNREDVEANYFDLPVEAAARRFAAGEEFAEVLRVVSRAPGRELLDFGAGNGIASYAFERAGWNVTALEPDASNEVGAGAIRRLCPGIRVVERAALPLPFNSDSFDAIHARQVLHHVPNVRATLREFARITRRQGIVIATREHVISSSRDLKVFLERHPLHAMYGGENAYHRDEYVAAFRDAGLRLLDVWGPTESIINFFPGTNAERMRLAERVGRGAGRYFRSVPGFRRLAWRWLSLRDRTPGRLYTFLAVKP